MPALRASAPCRAENVKFWPVLARLESEPLTEALRLNFTADNWFADVLKQFKKKQRIDSNKDAVQELFKSQEAEIAALKAELAAGSSSVAQLNEPSISPTTQRPQEPEKTATTGPSQSEHVRYLDTPPENAERTIELSSMTASLKSGVWTFSRKQQEALVFAERLLAIKNEKTRELMTIKAEGHREIERVKTEGREARARIQREVGESERNRPRASSRGGGHYPLDDNSEHGGPVDEYIR